MIQLPAKKDRKLIQEVLKNTIVVYDEFDWCKGSFARDEKGLMTSSHDQGACSFCIEGAITRALTISGEPRTFGFGCG